MYPSVGCEYATLACDCRLGLGWLDCEYHDIVFPSFSKSFLDENALARVPITFVFDGVVKEGESKAGPRTRKVL